MGIFDNDFDCFHELIVECSTVNWRPDIPVRDRAVTVLDRLAEYLDARGQRAAAGGLRNFIADNFTAYPDEHVELDETDETDETDIIKGASDETTNCREDVDHFTGNDGGNVLD